MQCTFSSDLDIATAARFPVSHYMLHCIQFVPKACISDAKECQCVDFRPSFKSNLVSIRDPDSIKDSLFGPRLLFKSRLQYENYSMATLTHTHSVELS